MAAQPAEGAAILTGVSTGRPHSGEPGTDRQVSPNHAALGLAVKELRTAAGISQEALADCSGLHRTYVGGIERGERNVSFSNLLKLAHALEVRSSELLARAESLRSATDQESSPPEQ